MPRGLGAAELLTEVRLRLARAHNALWAEAAARGPDAMLASTIVVPAGARRSLRLSVGRRFARLSVARRRLRQLTRDHSLVQEMFDAGAISASEAQHHPGANIITRAIGAESLELDKVTDRLWPGDRSCCAATASRRACPMQSWRRCLPGGRRGPSNMSPPRSAAAPTTTSPPSPSRCCRRPRTQEGRIEPIAPIIPTKGHCIDIVRPSRRALRALLSMRDVIDLTKDSSS